MAKEIGSPDSSVPKPSFNFVETASVISLLIGRSFYRFPREAKNVFERIAVASDYESSRSVLILTEPHESIESQFGVFKFLEVFFRDNPSLISKTIFLAEGIPANTPVSVKELVKVAPRPTDELIWETLSTALITGYIAYAWKHHHEQIPIVGTEDPVLYGLSSRLSKSTQGEETPESNLITTLAVVSRNKSMAETLIGQAGRYENPMLFAGAGHIVTTLLSQEQMGLISHNLEMLARTLSREELLHVHGVGNLRIHDYLESAKVGYTCFSHLQAAGESSTILENERYRKLFSAQQTGNYETYINWCLAQKLGMTTTSPSPEVAAQFVKKLLGSKPQNTQASESAASGATKASESKFIEAAEDFSDAGSIEPNFPGYTADVQQSLFKDYRWKLLQIYQGKTKKEAEALRYTREKIQIFGPRMRKDHPHRISHFATRFSRIPGAQEVINNAAARQWEKRYGSQLQLDTAEILGPERIRAFEETHQLPDGGINRIDIATRDDIAIECKNFRIITSRDINVWLDQASKRFELSIKDHAYKATIITVPGKITDKDFKKIEGNFRFYLKVDMPDLSGKIWLCRLNDLQNTLNKIRK